MNGDVSGCGFPENSEVFKVMSVDGNGEIEKLIWGPPISKVNLMEG